MSSDYGDEETEYKITLVFDSANGNGKGRTPEWADIHLSQRLTLAHLEPLIVGELKS